MALAAALLSGYPHFRALADLPRGVQLTFGQAQVQTTAPGQMTISQSSARAGLDWQSFSIGSGQSVLVQQPSANAVLVNRVVGSDPSLILGSLRANGSVWLLNPSGIVFGANSQVNVGGLMASTLMARDGLQSGRLVLERGPNGAGELVANGTITAPNGSVVLAAPQLTVGTQAHIQAQRIGLAAATHVSVDVEGDGLMLFNVSNDGSLDTRLNVLGNASASAGGSVEARAAARAGFADTVLNLEGVVRARSLSTRQGQIVIDGGAAGTTRVAGHVDASGTNTDERGGQVQLLGQHIRLDTGAKLNASGPAGGGTVLVGGDWQGSGNLPQATTVTMAAGTHIDASATHNGDGGKVVLWSDVKSANSVTTVHGSVTAKGGPQGGNGGQVETSGHALNIDGITVNSGAVAGQAGLWLLDPSDYTVTSTAATAIGNALQNSDVLITTTADPGNGGTYTSGNGDINFESSITRIAGTATTTLTLKAERDININGYNITSSSGKLNLLLSSNSNLSGGGMIYLNNAALTSAGGNITLGGGADGSSYAEGSVGSSFRVRGIYAANSAINAGGGNIVMRGKGWQSSAVTDGQYPLGIDLVTSTVLQTSGTGSISLNGVGGFNGNASTHSAGINLFNGVQISTENGALSLSGTGGTGLQRDYAGIMMDGGTTATSVYSASGAITLTGVGSASNPGSPGIKSAGTAFNVGWDGGSTVTTGAVTLNADVFEFSSAFNLRGTGAMTVQPVSSSFGVPFDWLTTNFNLGSTPNSLTLGKTGNTAKITVHAATTVSGPIRIEGNLDLNAPITSAASLSVSGTSDLGANVTTSGSQSYTGAVTLSGANRTLTTTDSNITFSSTIDSATAIAPATQTARALTLAMGTGTATFGGAVGATNALGALAITGALDLNADITSAASLSVSGTSDLGANVTTSGAQTYSGAVTLSGGNRTLSTTNTASDNTTNNTTSGITFSSTSSTINSEAGENRNLTLAMTSGTARLDGAVGGTRALGAIDITGNLDLNAAIAGAASLSVSGSSDLGANVTTSGAQTYSGAVTLSGGARTLSASTVNTQSALAGGNNAMTISGIADIDGAYTNLASLSISGSTDLGANVTTSGAQTYTGAVTVAADSVATASSITMPTLALQSGATGHQLTVTNTDATSNITGQISGTGALVKRGTGTLTLSGPNTYSGSTSINAGTLKAGSATAFGSGSAIVSNGAALDLNGQTMTSAGGLTLNGSGISNSGSLLNSSSHPATYAGLVTLGSDSLIVGGSGAIALTNTGIIGGDTFSLTLGGAVGGSIASDIRTTTGSLTKQNAGTWTLSGNNTYSGSTNVNAGTLKAGSATAFGSNSAVTLAVVISTMLDLNGNDISIGSLAGGGNTGGTVVLGNKTLTTGGNNVDTNFAGAISGTGGLSKTGTGTLTLSGLNTYTGTTTVSAGTLAITHNNALGGTGAGGGTTVNSNTTLDLRGVDIGAEAITLNGGTLATSSGASGISGTVTLGANANFSVSGSSLNMTGAVNGPYALTVTGPGALTLAGGVGQTTALTSLNATGPLTLASNVTTTDGQTYTGAVTVSGSNRMLTGHAITTNNMNTPSVSSLSLTADTVDISAGNLPLTLGSVTAGAGGSIRAGTVHLNGQMTVRSGTLTLLASADASGNTTNSNKLSPTQNSVYYSADVVTQGTSGKIDLLQGARLVVLAPGNSANGGVGGSVALTHADNSFAGELEILSGAANATWSDHRDNGQSVQGRVQVNGYGVRIGGAGIEADIVSVRANQLSTLGNAVITARMPFNNAMEASATVPGLTLDLTPAAFTLASPFGRTGAEIAVGVGYGASFNAGLVSALPQNGAQGATAVVLKGPAVGNGYTFYSTNAGDQTAIPVYYNGLMPSTPEVSGAISATISVIENARRQGFEEALRTENVATRLRSGVIAEVGPGRSATTGSQGIALPELCDPGVTGDCNGEEK